MTQRETHEQPGEGPLDRPEREAGDPIGDDAYPGGGTHDAADGRHGRPDPGDRHAGRAGAGAEPVSVGRRGWAPRWTSVHSGSHRHALPFGAWQSTLTRSPRTPPPRSSSGTEDRLAAMRHSAAHMMAAAVLELFPDAKLGIGPAIKDGFYYDFDLPRPLTPADLEQIEAKMREQQAADLAFEHSKDLPRADAVAELEREGPAVQGRDRERPARVRRADRQLLPARLVRGPVPRRAPRLDEGAGRRSSSSTRPAPTGAATRRARCSSASTARRGTHRRSWTSTCGGIEEAKKRDHRKLGRELDLFTFHPESPAAPFLHPRGMALWRALEDWSRQVRREAGFAEVRTPSLVRKELWETSPATGTTTRTTCSSWTTTTTSPG